MSGQGTDFILRAMGHHGGVLSRRVMRLDLLPVGSFSGYCMEHGQEAERVVSRSPLLSRFKAENTKSEAADGETWTMPRMSQRDGKN